MKSDSLSITAITLSPTDPIQGRQAQVVNIQAFLRGYPELPGADQLEDVFLVPNQTPLTPTRRLVVIVPLGDIDENTLARKIWQLASGSSLPVLYLAFEPEASYHSYQCRRLSGLASMTSTAGVRAKAKVSEAENWAEALRSILHPGDLFVCLACHRYPGSFIQRKVLGPWLAESMGKPVYMLGGFHLGPTVQRRQWNKEIRAWAASLVLMAVFFVFQITIDRSMSGSVSTLLLCGTILVEIYSLFKINEWFG